MALWPSTPPEPPDAPTAPAPPPRLPHQRATPTPEPPAPAQRAAAPKPTPQAARVEQVAPSTPPAAVDDAPIALARPPAAAPDAPAAQAAPDAPPDDAPPPDPGWELHHDDPVNAQALGPGRWMAQLPDDEAVALDAEIDDSPALKIAATQATERALYAATRDLAQRAGALCHAHLQRRMPGAHGQLMLRVWSSADTRGARVEQTLVVSALDDLKDPSFQRCVRDQLVNQRLNVSGEARVNIAYPLWLP